MAKSKLRPKLGAPKLGTHQKTQTNTVIVQLAAALGHSHEKIAKLVGIALPTLKAHYADELEHGADQLNLKVAAALATAATTVGNKQQVNAAKFWLQCRAGWRGAESETKVDVESPASAGDGQPFKFTIRIGDAKPVDG
jgi:hypothetical protein